MGCSPQGREQSDTTERLHFHFSLSCIGEGNGNPLQCSCLENPRDGGAWWASVYGVAQSRTQLKRLSSSSSSITLIESNCSEIWKNTECWILLSFGQCVLSFKTKCEEAKLSSAGCIVSLEQENICYWTCRQCLSGCMINPLFHWTSLPSVKNIIF